MVEAVAPLSNGVQVGLRIPVVLIGLFGVVFVLVSMRKVGPVAGVLGALGSLFIAGDQLVNIVWVLHLSSISKEANFDADHFTTVNNLYTITDAVLITIGAALLVVAIVVRRPGAGPAQPGFPGQFGGPGQPGQFAPPQAPGSGAAPYPAQPGYPAFPAQPPQGSPGQPPQAFPAQPGYPPPPTYPPQQ
jgi:hypothetical protein